MILNNTFASNLDDFVTKMTSVDFQSFAKLDETLDYQHTFYGSHFVDGKKAIMYEGLFTRESEKAVPADILASVIKLSYSNIPGLSISESGILSARFTVPRPADEKELYSLHQLFRQNL